MAKTAKRRKNDAKKLGWLRWGKFVFIVLAILIAAFLVLVGLSRVDGISMYPTIKSGEAAGYLRLHKEIERDDIVYVRMADGKTYIKRVVGLPGDVIDIHDGTLYVNGVAADTRETTPHSSKIDYPLTLEEDMYFVAGDNRAESVDSRDFGPVAKSQIRGKIIFHFSITFLG